jgi:hypothetical protein
MAAPLEFYEVVCVLPNDVVPKRLWGTCGVVVGRTDDGVLGLEYAVQVIADNNQCWQLPEQCLRPVGRRMTREELYDGDSLSIVVEPDTGVGTPAKK